MAQCLSSLSNITPLTKSSNTIHGQTYAYLHDPMCHAFGLTKPRKVNSGVKAMRVEKRDNLDHLQRLPLKRREATTAPLGLWDRFPNARTVQQMMDTMDRMMEDPVTVSSRWPSQAPNEGNGYVRGRTPWEIKEGEAEYKIRFDMPGMTKDDVKVWVEENMLVFKAAKVPKKKHDQENGVAVEDDEEWPAKSFGTYSSRIALPDNVDFEKIKAEVRDGVLYLTIPKPSSRSKVFDVNVG